MVAASALQAGDWPLWRGDSGMTGVCAEALTFPLKLQWKYTGARPVKATAVSDGTLFYIGDAKGKFVALKGADGSVAWEYQAKDGIEGSAALTGGVVVFGSLDGTVVALDAATGKEKWSYKTEAEVRGSPNVFPRPDKPALILIGSYDNRLYALDSQTGEKVWAAETGNYINGSAGLVEGKAAFGGCDGFLYFVNAMDGKDAGKFDVQNPIASTVATRGNLVVAGHYGNEIVCIDAATMQPKWTYKEREFPFFSSPAFSADGFIYAGDRGKRLHCISVADGTEKWAFRTKGRVDSSPVLTGTSVVAGSDDGCVYAVAAADGAEVWKYEIGQPVQTSPCIAGGRLVMGADDGVIYGFGQ